MTLSMPLPRSSQMLAHRITEARASLRERGGSSMNRSGSIRGRPGLVISIRSANISTVGPAPVIVKSWWIRALATSSRTASSGYIQTVVQGRLANLLILRQLIVDVANRPLKAHGVALAAWLLSKRVDAIFPPVDDDAQRLASQPAEIGQAPGE